MQLVHLTMMRLRNNIRSIQSTHYKGQQTKKGLNMRWTWLTSFLALQSVSFSWTHQAEAARIGFEPGT